LDLSQLLTFAALVTPPGAVVAAVLIRYVVELAKRYVPAPGDVLALVATVLLYVAAAVAVTPTTSDGWLNLVWTGFLALGAAIGIDGIISHAQEVQAIRAQLNTPPGV
jgi:hypothetical protein